MRTTGHRCEFATVFMRLCQRCPSHGDHANISCTCKPIMLMDAGEIIMRRAEQRSHLDSNAALALHLQLVQKLRLAADLDGARRLQQPVRQRRLACGTTSGSNAVL